MYHYSRARFRLLFPIMWEVRCAVHGLHHVKQKTEPIICKIKVQLSPRYVRQCRKRLTSAIQIPQKEILSDRFRETSVMRPIDEGKPKMGQFRF